MNFLDPVVHSTASVIRLIMCTALRPHQLHADCTLEGACGVASYALQRALTFRGRRATFVLGWHECDCGNGEECDVGLGHCWVETGGAIVDITARQFHRSAADVFVPSPAELRRYQPEARGTRGVSSARSWYRYRHSWMLTLFEPKTIDPLVIAALQLQDRDERARREP